jgi:mono/diheme cytochrome c family protein
MLSVGMTALAQEAPKPKIERTPAKYTSPASGKEMFDAYCASCHGTDAKGNGPAAPAMKNPVPDLTTLAKANGGDFPSAHVYQVIKGDSAVPAHGSADMPVWGPVFSHLAMAGNAQVQQRIHNLTKYLESLQTK